MPRSTNLPPAALQALRTLTSTGLGPTSSTADVVKVKREIERDLAGHDAITVLAFMVPRLAFSRPDIYSELDDEPAAPMEYIASILLERAGREPSGEPAPRESLSASLQRSIDRARGVMTQTIMGGRVRRKEATDPLEAIAEDVQVHDAISRWAGYVPQEEAMLRQLAEADGVNESIKQALGFDVEQALALGDAAGRLLEERFNAYGERAADSANETEAAWGGESVRRRSTATQRRRSLQALADAYFSDALVEALLLTPAEIAESAGVDDETAQAFLAAFSARFGDTRGTSLMRGSNTVRTHPFVHTGDGRVLLTAPGNLLWSLRPAIESALKDSGQFEPYQVARATYVEEHAAKYLAGALRTDQTWINVGYEIDGSSFEVDAMLRVDNTCLIVEAKAGGVSPRALQGRKKQLKHALSELVGRAAEQGDRLETLLTAGQTPRFFDRQSQAAIPIDLDGVDRIEVIVVTLEVLGFLGVDDRLLRDAGILAEGAVPPWIVSLFDLEAITASTRFTSTLTSYIGRRRSLDSRVEFLDECDLWMMHLRETLDFSRIQGHWILVEGRSDPLHQAWLFGVAQPTAKLSGPAKKRLQRLERERRPGFLEEAESVFLRSQAGRTPRVVNS